MLGDLKRVKQHTQHLSTSLDDLSTSPDHSNNRAGKHVGHEFREKRLRLEIPVVLFKERTGRVHHFQGEELVPATLESGDDFSNETSLNSVGFFV